MPHDTPITPLLCARLLSLSAKSESRIIDPQHALAFVAPEVEGFACTDSLSMIGGLDHLDVLGTADDLSGPYGLPNRFDCGLGHYLNMGRDNVMEKMVSGELNGCAGLLKKTRQFLKKFAIGPNYFRRAECT